MKKRKLNELCLQNKQNTKEEEHEFVQVPSYIYHTNEERMKERDEGWNQIYRKMMVYGAVIAVLIGLALKLKYWCWWIKFMWVIYDEVAFKYDDYILKSIWFTTFAWSSSSQGTNFSSGATGNPTTLSMTQSTLSKILSTPSSTTLKKLVHYLLYRCRHFTHQSSYPRRPTSSISLKCESCSPKCIKL